MGLKVGQYNIDTVHTHPRYKEWLSKLLFAGKGRSDHGRDIKEVASDVEREIQDYKNNKQHIDGKYNNRQDGGHHDDKNSEESEDSEEEIFLRSKKSNCETQNYAQQTAQHNRPALQAGEEDNGMNSEQEIVPPRHKRSRIDQDQESNQQSVPKVKAEEEDVSDVVFVATRSIQRGDRVQRDIAQPQRREGNAQEEHTQSQDKVTTLLEYYGGMNSADLAMHYAASATAFLKITQQQGWISIIRSTWW